MLLLKTQNGALGSPKLVDIIVSLMVLSDKDCIAAVLQGTYERKWIREWARNLDEQSLNGFKSNSVDDFGYGWQDGIRELMCYTDQKVPTAVGSNYSTVKM